MYVTYMFIFLVVIAIVFRFCMQKKTSYMIKQMAVFFKEICLVGAGNMLVSVWNVVYERKDAATQMTDIFSFILCIFTENMVHYIVFYRIIFVLIFRK